MRTWGLLATGTPCFLKYTTLYSQIGSRALSRLGDGMSMPSSQDGDGGDVAQGPQTFTYAYCHGFLSGPGSIKGQTLRRSALEEGIDLCLLNLNGPENDPGAITCSGAVQAVRDFHVEKKAALGDPKLKLRLVGSSLGGYTVARYASLYPDEVDRIFMLCPSFCLASRAPNIVSTKDAEKWKQEGSWKFPLSTGGEAEVPWSFIEDAVAQPDYPEYKCPAVIVHGLDDHVVPAKSTRDIVEGSTDLAKRTSVIFVEDDHSLTKDSTLSTTVKALIDFWDLAGDKSPGSAVRVDGTEEDTPVQDPQSFQKNVEVEAKFPVDDVGKIKEAILSRGGVLVGEQVFIDVYWDAPECGLTARDWWLRNRAGRWELKIPAAWGDRETTATDGQASQTASGAEAYWEVTADGDIAKELKTLEFPGLSDSSSSSGQPLDDRVLEAAGFETFASFRTNRIKYRLDGYTIDIDEASFGHRLMEIELMSGPGGAEIKAASEGVAALAKSLGVAGDAGSDRRIRLISSRDNRYVRYPDGLVVRDDYGQGIVLEPVPPSHSAEATHRS